ncbi:MAG TPA: pyridoxamine 5'-phosphate oxidase family protein [Jiangellaceae bacterium]|nr:pyridoxamine 5'-phosphate oxidase family protein [Jiangellaceae bacterium]
MTARYASIAFTDTVRDAQTRYGSRKAYARLDGTSAQTTGPDTLTEIEKEFIAERDGFYLATASETGWPYVQFRGGPRGFLRVIDDHTIGWADFRGNRQYISTGNMTNNNRVALFLMDYAHQARLKIFGHAWFVDADAEPDLVRQVSVADYRARIERAVVVHVEAFDWNCPQHITPRYTIEEINSAIDPIRERLAELEGENEQLRAQIRAVDSSPEAHL